MIQRTLGERFCVWWWDGTGEDWIQNLASLLCWPVMIETDNVEVWNGGGA